MRCCQGPVQNKYVLLAAFKLHYLQCQWDRKQATFTHTSTILLGSSMHINAQRRPIKRLKCFCPSRVYWHPLTSCGPIIVFGKIKKEIFLKFWQLAIAICKLFHWMQCNCIKPQYSQILFPQDFREWRLRLFVCCQEWFIFFFLITRQKYSIFSLCNYNSVGFTWTLTGHMTFVCHIWLCVNANANKLLWYTWWVLQNLSNFSKCVFFKCDFYLGFAQFSV